MSGPRRKPTRLSGFDYATAGAYFVTICTEGRHSLFGKIEDEVLHPSVAGLAVQSWWEDIGRRFPHVTVGISIVMPNHLHGVLFIGAEPKMNSRDGEKGGHAGPPLHGKDRGGVGEARCGLPVSGRGVRDEPPTPLTNVIGWFKSMSTNDYIRGVKEFGFPPFQQRLWQRSFHDHVIRNEDDLVRIEAYILDNPRNWAKDDQNPAC